jgi:hypothetical protein
MTTLRSIVVASLLALSAASQPMQVSAQAVADAEVERFDSRKFVDYAGCALSVGFATGTGSWLLAGLVCYRAFTEHWDT